MKKAKHKNKHIELQKNERKNYLYQLGALVVFVFILYGNTIQNNYSFDDIYVTNNREVERGFSAIPKLFSSLYANMLEDGKPLTFGYRPIVKVSFAVEYGFFGKNPHMSHFINILLYLLTCILLFKILLKLLQGYHALFPFVIVLIFMAHPSHTEVVSSLKNRDELLSFLGAIGTLYLFLKYFDTQKLRFALLGLVVFLLGYFSKPTITVFIPLFPIVLYFFTKPKTGQVLFFLLGVIVVAYLATIAPRLYLPRPHRPVQFIENQLYFEESFWLRASTGLSILWFYLQKLVLPHPLVFYYGYDMVPTVGWNNWKVIASLFAHLGLFGYALYKIREKHILSFGILVYLVAVATFSNVFKQAMGIVADRFMYFPSFGFSIVIAYFIFKLSKIEPKSLSIQSKKLTTMAVIVMILLIPYTGKTITRNSQWDSQVKLLRADIDNAKESAKANLIYSGTMKGEVMRALKGGIKMNPKIRAEIKDIKYRLKLATDLYEDYYQAWDMLGTIYMALENDYSGAIPYFDKALSIKPDYVPGFTNRGYCNSKLKNYSQAILDFESALEIDAESLQANGELYKVYKELGDIELMSFYGQKTKELQDERRRRAGFKP